MTVSIEPLHCGTLTAGRSMFEEGGSDGAVELPVPAWLIRHSDGVVLFDTGMHDDLSPATAAPCSVRCRPGSCEDPPMGSLSGIAPAFGEMAHRIVWCTTATVDPDGQPRTRVLHPIREWGGTALTGELQTWRR